jgi:hypothetical protein
MNFTVDKNDTSLLFFLLCFNFFSIVILLVYIEGIFLSVKFLKNLLIKIFSRYFRLYLSILVDLDEVKVHKQKHDALYSRELTMLVILSTSL